MNKQANEPKITGKYKGNMKVWEIKRTCCASGTGKESS